MLLSLILIIVTIGLYLANNGNPFFLLASSGLNERIFKIIKFKTMNDKRVANGNLLSETIKTLYVMLFL